jgi:uncharacterized membrane protein YagU involved in acid resistance
MSLQLPAHSIPSRSSETAPSWQQQVLIGIAGGLLGAFTMNTFGRAVLAAGNGREADGAAPGMDRVGRGVQPPQAEALAEDDATVRVGTMAYRAVTGSEPDSDARPWLGSAAHYGFAATVGACYALMRERMPLMRAGYGTLYGTAVWIVADETIMPALRLSRGPRQLPAGVHAYALAGHWVYGLTLEFVSRLADGRRSEIQERTNTFNA